MMPDSSRPHKCSTCGASFKFKNHLNGHLKLHTAKSFRCSSCPRSFHCDHDLQRHQKLHGRPQSYPCPICPKKYSRKDNLDAHRRTHKEIKKFTCPLCPDKTYSTSYNLLCHNRRSHSAGLPFSCNYCDKKFAESGDWKKHLIIHGIYRPYSCKKCQKRFRLKKELTLHEATHTKNKYKSLKPSSRAHRRAPGESQDSNNKMKGKSSETKATTGKSIKSKKCASTQTPWDYLQEDEEKLTKDNMEKIVKSSSKSPAEKNQSKEKKKKKKKKPFLCSCGKYFSSSKMWGKHGKKEGNDDHSLEIHECPYCTDESFDNMRDFREHYEDVHLEFIHECPICLEAFPTIKRLGKHFSQHDSSLYYLGICS